jgi:hypothetical protein
VPASQRRAGRRDERRRGGSECGQRDAREIRIEPAKDQGRVGLCAELAAAPSRFVWFREANRSEYAFPYTERQIVNS